MLSKLTLRYFTAFTDAELQFSPGLNVFVGDNGTGKTHLLKASYSVLAVLSEDRRNQGEDAPLTKSELQRRLADKLVNVFRPESLGRLATRRQGRSRSHVAIDMESEDLSCAFSFATQSRSEVTLERKAESTLEKRPVYLPTRELLSIYPGFVPIYENHYLEFEETWRDTCLLLGAPTLKGPRENRAKKLLQPLEDIMGGRIVFDTNGRFYLQQPGKGRMEMGVVAEGWRKIATLAHLIGNGALLDHGYLFWDEPESNLNPRLIRSIARTIMAVASQGVQVFIATHSLFLLRELEILSSDPVLKDVPQRFFALGSGPDGVVVTQGESAEEINPLVLLDEELEQSDRYIEMG